MLWLPFLPQRIFTDQTFKQVLFTNIIEAEIKLCKST